MRVEFLLSGFFGVIGLLGVAFPRHFTDFIVAGSHVISAHRGADVNASARWQSMRVTCALIVAFSIWIVVGGAQREPRDVVPAAWEVVGPAVVSGVLTIVGLSVLLFRRRLIALAAQRLRINGGEIYVGSLAERHARAVVLVFAAWVLLLAGLSLAFAIVRFSGG
ncbi:hypothetical protein [Microbacterium sp. PMB16]|uniref:hypothetical protein n=1 Tax=Microbacterium sp. PMB16 TaxID=3120157 RepID=UPI003F4B456C